MEKFKLTLTCKKIVLDYLKYVLEDLPYKFTTVVQASYDYCATHDIPEEIETLVYGVYDDYLQHFSENTNIGVEVYEKDKNANPSISSRIPKYVLIYLEVYKNLFDKGDFISYAKEKLNRKD